jgi:hypothetical protein
MALAQAVKQVAEWNDKYEISVQGEGKAHLMVVLAALAILLWALHESRPVLRFGLPPLVVLIFSDVAYVAYLNSFFMDAAAMVFLLLTVSLACAAILRPRAWVAVAFGIAAGFFTLSKSQHAFLGPLLAALALWFAWSSPRGADRRFLWPARLWLVSGAGAIVATGAMVRLTTAEYRTYPLYNLIFFSLAKQSPEPAKTLAELGLPPSYLPLVGTHSYSPNVPSSEGPWDAAFLARTSYSKLVEYYLHHPGIALDRLWETLSVNAAGIRPGELGNYSPKAGYPVGARAHRFDLWSNLRSWLLRTLPLHVAAFYLLVAGTCVWCMFRPPVAAQWPFYPIALVLVLCGAIEFGCGALLDCLETARHLFLFHVITEMLIVCVVAGLMCRAAERFHGRPDRADG